MKSKLLFVFSLIVFVISLFVQKKERVRVIYLPEIREAVTMIDPVTVEPDREDLTKKMHEVVDLFLEEKLPFDEPRIEVGQEDGKLREFWKVAWRKGRSSFGYRGAKYYVRLGDGRPIPPQVCADFVVDVFDRTGGNWWYSSGYKGYRVDKENSLTMLIKSHDKYERRVVDLIDVMLNRPDLFEPIYHEQRNGVRVGDYKALRQTMDDIGVQFGDIVFINGRTPWDRHHEHWHSFLIYSFDEEENDYQIVGNAAMIAKRRLLVEGRRTPHRKLWYVFRPTNLLLLKIENGEVL